MRTKPARQPIGRPTGGQFAVRTRSEALTQLRESTQRFPGLELPESPLAAAWYDVNLSWYDQKQTEPFTTRLSDLPPAQQRTMEMVTGVLDEMRGMPAQGVPAEQRRHTYGAYVDDDGMTAVYVWSEMEPWTTDDSVMRAVLDSYGDVHQLHIGTRDQFGISWRDLSVTK